MLLSLGTCIKSSSLGKSAVAPGFWLLSSPGGLLTAHRNPLYTHGFSFSEREPLSWGWWVPGSWPSMKMSQSRSKHVDRETWKHPRVKHILHKFMGVRNLAVTPWNRLQTRHQKASRCGRLVSFPTGHWENCSSLLSEDTGHLNTVLLAVLSLPTGRVQLILDRQQLLKIISSLVWESFLYIFMWSVS